MPDTLPEAGPAAATPLRGQVAIVTGGASGIGFGIARRLAAAGATAILADLSAEAAARAAATLREEGLAAEPAVMDVSDEAAVEAATEGVIARFGRIDVLVSNAGIQIVRPIEEFPLAEWRRMMAIHLDGAFLTTRACLRQMYRQNSGSIVYIGSVHSKIASVLKAPYVTAKHGLIGLARVVAKEGAKRGVRANVVCPGFVRTPLVERQIPEQARALGLTEEAVVREVMLRDTVDGLFTTVEDVAEAVLLFASPKGAALTGQSLLVSHGWGME